MGAFVSWEDDHGWDGGYDGGGDGEEFEEWIELFTDLMKGALALTRSGRHAEAAQAYRMLLRLLKEAEETTDILGNHSAPEDSMSVDFGKVVEAYMRSLLGCRSGIDEAILHLNSGKSTRAAPAAHYCAIVAEISRLLEEPGLWEELLRHLKRLHGKKRLIWEKLKAEGCPPA